MNAFIHMSDEEIIKSCLSGETRSQKLLFDKYSRKMMGICLRYAAGREEAEDMLQEGWIKIFKNLGSFRFEGSAEGWIKRVIVNTCLDYIRKTKRMFNQVEIEVAGEMLHPEIGIHSPDTLTEKDLLKMIHQLSPGYRTVFNLFAIEGYSHKEIGEMLSISESTSKSQYSRARVQLQKMFQEENV
jgi:RNA polymerase sigma factor (sigma-70 family)